MATTLYLPSSGSPAVTPTDDHSSWEAKSTNIAWLAAVTSKGTTAIVSVQSNEVSVNPAGQRSGYGWVYGPLAANAISGTIDYQFRGKADTFSNLYRACIAIWVMKPDGTLRSTILNAQDSIDDIDWTTSFQLLSKAGVSISTQTPTAGDYVVVEIGADTSTSGFIDSDSFYVETGENHATNFGSITFSSGLTLAAPSSLTYTNDAQQIRIGDAITDMVATVDVGGCTFTVQSGALPTGVSLNATSGTISGTPTQTGSFTFVIRATNGGGSTDSASLTMGVRQVGGSISMNINI